MSDKQNGFRVNFTKFTNYLNDLNKTKPQGQKKSPSLDPQKKKKIKKLNARLTSLT